MSVSYIGLALCECGHPFTEHAEGYVCTHPMDDPEDGWYGVCPCVRCDDDCNRWPLA